MALSYNVLLLKKTQQQTLTEQQLWAGRAQSAENYQKSLVGFTYCGFL